MSDSEFDIIKRHFLNIGSEHARPGIVLGIGDDAAILEIPAGKHQCVSTDMLVESIHFPVDADPFFLGQKALAVNLSDLAAMGAEPFCFTLSIALPEYDASWLEKFAKGLAHLAQEFDCPLVGGDTTQGPLVISIHVMGLTDAGNGLRRDQAMAGDAVMVTGSLGKGAIGLAATGLPVHYDGSLHQNLNIDSADIRKTLQQFYLTPQPRIAFGCQVAPLINSAIDISDGLLGDLQHILDRSEVGAVLRLDDIPFDPAVTACTTPAQRLGAALYGGDDYEICFTARQKNLPELEEIAHSNHLAITQIGEIHPEKGLHLVDAKGEETRVTKTAFRHFTAGGGA